MLARLALLLAACLALAYAQQALPTGSYIQNPASELVYLTMASPDGFPLYLYNMQLTVGAGGNSMSGLVVFQEQRDIPAFDNVTFTAQVTCDRQSGGLNVGILTCTDPGQLCETGWFYDTAGKGPYAFGPGIDSATNKTTLNLSGSFLSAASTVPLICTNGSCGAATTSVCGSYK